MGVYRLAPCGPGLAGLPPDPATTAEDLAPGSPMPDERANCVAEEKVPRGEVTVQTSYVSFDERMHPLLRSRQPRLTFPSADHIGHLGGVCARVRHGILPVLGVRLHP
jgi:hypothetical protein